MCKDRFPTFGYHPPPERTLSPFAGICSQAFVLVAGICRRHFIWSLALYLVAGTLVDDVGGERCPTSSTRAISSEKGPTSSTRAALRVDDVGGEKGPTSSTRAVPPWLYSTSTSILSTRQRRQRKRSVVVWTPLACHSIGTYLTCRESCLLSYRTFFHTRNPCGKKQNKCIHMCILMYE